MTLPAVQYLNISNYMLPGDYGDEGWIGGSHNNRDIYMSILFHTQPSIESPTLIH